LAETDRRTRVASRVFPHVPQRFVSDERLVVLMRRGDRGAFESLYDRHVAELLSFCFFMLGSREDAEDAVQSAFASAYRALLRDGRSVDVRPWLFAIARNACIGILRKRRSQDVEEMVRPACEDVLAKVERRESVRQLLSGMLELPERHRTALILAELHGQSQSEIGELLGVAPTTVKSYIFQARATLNSERAARETDCREIRAELVTARGAALLRGRLRRHLRACAGCREYAHDVSHRRRELGALLPLLPSLALKRRVLDATAGQATGVGACVGGAGAGVSLSGAIELGGAGAKTLLAKVLIAATGLGAGASAGTLVLGVASSQPVAPGVRVALASDSAHRQSALTPDGTSSALVPGSSAAGLPLVRSSAPVGGPAAGRGKGSGSGAAGAGQAGHARAVAAGAGSSGNGNSNGGGNGNGNAHGAKANGNSAEHGNSAAAHAGAKGKSAEHGHSAEHGNSASHGNAGAHGNPGAHGNSQSHGNSGSHGSSAGAGNANGRAVGRTNSAGSPSAAAHGNAAGQAHGAEPAAQAKAVAVQGQGGSSPGASAGQVKGGAQPGQAPAAEARPNTPPGEAKPSPGSSAEHGASGAGGHEAPGHGAS
jgi:RNA polymerase sigma factor (sigma-70 family)